MDIQADEKPVDFCLKASVSCDSDFGGWWWRCGFDAMESDAVGGELREGYGVEDGGDVAVEIPWSLDLIE